MNQVIRLENVSKSYGRKQVLNNLNTTLGAGQIIGLIGQNGAGKSTLLRAILGQIHCEGNISVLGADPFAKRSMLMQRVCAIADTGTLPHWMTVAQALDCMDALHPRFNRERAEDLLAKTDISSQAKVAGLSKGMVTQLHLCLVLSVDVELLVLDEPTLGLDPLYRRIFYELLMEANADENKTILISTHEVVETQLMISHLIFLQQGEFILDMSMDQVMSQYALLETDHSSKEAVEQLDATLIRESTGTMDWMIKGGNAEQLEVLGEVKRPNVMDLFIALSAAPGITVENNTGGVQ